MKHSLSLKNYISHIFEYCSNYICMNNAFCNFFSYLNLDLQTEVQYTHNTKKHKVFYNNITCC